MHKPPHETNPEGSGFAYVTLLREPEALLLSYLKWFCHTNGLDGDWTRCLDEHPGLPNLQIKMLNGFHLKNATPPLTSSELSIAVARLMGLDFFGITDRWSESVCLFHAVFGGTPRPSQFINVREGPQRHVPRFIKEWVKYSSALDTVLYAQSVRMFECRIQEVLESQQGPAYRACVAKYSGR